MSLHEVVVVPCPGCETETKVTIWKSLNVSIDPEAKELLLAGKINVLHCPKCNDDYVLGTPLMYHDMQNRFTVHYVPFESLQFPEGIAGFKPDGALNIDPMVLPDAIKEQSGYLMNPHIVFDMGELVRYVIFRELLAAMHGFEDTAEPSMN